MEDADCSFSQPLEPSDRALGEGDFAQLIGRIEAAAGSGGPETTSDAGPQNSGDASSADAALCAGELPFPPVETPATCPARCASVRASPFSSANSCINYANSIVIGCMEGEGPPVIACVERSDGQRFVIGSGWAFPVSTAYKLCSDAVAMTVTQAPRCP